MCSLWSSYCCITISVSMVSWSRKRPKVILEILGVFRKHFDWDQTLHMSMIRILIDKLCRWFSFSFSGNQKSVSIWKCIINNMNVMYFPIFSHLFLVWLLVCSWYVVPCFTLQYAFSPVSLLSGLHCHVSLCCRKLSIFCQHRP